MTSELTTLLAATLSGAGMLAGVDPERITALRPLRRQLAEGAVLFRRGDRGACAYLILDGILGLNTGEGADALSFFRKVVAGELVGEYGPLCGEPRSPRPWPSRTWNCWSWTAASCSACWRRRRPWSSA